MFADYYSILEVSPDATVGEIKQAFRRQAIKWHPDKNPDTDTTEVMQLINEAYLILSDQEAREHYDGEYNKFVQFQSQGSSKKKTHQTSHARANDSSQYYNSNVYSNYTVEDDVLGKWMANARKQAVDLAKQTIKDFKDIGKAGVKAATKEAGNYLVGYIIVGIVLTILMSLVGQCN